MATAAPAATGKVIQITGPVVDIEFPAGQLPAIYNAVAIQRDGQPDLVCEVQQHLGNNWVRSVAMTTTDGLARGVPVLDTGAPITVPVGEVTLGRVFDVLGRPIDNKGEVNATTSLPIHRDAPPFDQQSTEVEVFETGLKIIDLICPFKKGGKIGIYRAVLENNASEQSARMIAMRNSTDNANELIDDLTLVYNKTRQATITREMIEIASGAEALG